RDEIAPPATTIDWSVVVKCFGVRPSHSLYHCFLSDITDGDILAAKQWLLLFGQKFLLHKCSHALVCLRCLGQYRQIVGVEPRLVFCRPVPSCNQRRPHTVKLSRSAIRAQTCKSGTIEILKG